MEEHHKQCAEGDLHSKLIGLEAHLQCEVLNQPDAVAMVASAVKRGELGLVPKGRPRGSFLFLGPTGVGKTQLVKSLSIYVFGNAGLVSFDMSEFQGGNAMTQFLGSHTEKGRFWDGVSKLGGAGVLLLDEIDKADRTILDLLLQILDEGRVTLACGQVVNLENFYIFLTSNIASEEILASQRKVPAVARRRFAENKARQFLRPELFARFDAVEVFQPIPFAVRVEIARMIATREAKRLEALGESVEEFLCESLFVMCACDGKLGARPILRRIQMVLQQYVVDRKLGLQQ